MQSIPLNESGTLWRVVLARANVPAFKKVYSEKILRHIAESFDADNGGLGYFINPDNTRVGGFQKTCCAINMIFFENDFLYAEIKIWTYLPYGKVLKELLITTQDISFSLLGSGSGHFDDNGNLEFNENYKFSGNICVTRSQEEVPKLNNLLQEVKDIEEKWAKTSSN